MKLIKYYIATEINYGTEKNPNVKTELQEKIRPYSEQNKAEAINEAYNGECEIIDDGQPEPEPSREEQLEADVEELKEALDLILSGVTE